MHDKNLHIIVAPTDLGYAEAIAKFQVDMAIESEGKGRYVLGIIDGKPVGSLMLTREWSDWSWPDQKK